MDNLKWLLNPFIEHILPATGCKTIPSGSKVHIEDKRVAQLLLVLHEIDRAVAGLEGLPQTDLTELVSSAILACGFVDGTEARYAIAAVLEAIERRGPTPESS